uniref:hypothetical protein n=1 Tax=Bartonella massiliensis TaxID=929795 RepID=UPI001AEEA839
CIFLDYLQPRHSSYKVHIVTVSFTVPRFYDFAYLQKIRNCSSLSRLLLSSNLIDLLQIPSNHNKCKMMIRNILRFLTTCFYRPYSRIGFKETLLFQAHFAVWAGA